MSYYAELLQNSEYLRGITSEVRNSSDPYPSEEFLKRFDKNVQTFCAHSKEKMQQSSVQPAVSN